MNVDNIVKAILARCKALLTTSPDVNVTHDGKGSLFGKNAIAILIEEGLVMLPDDERALCPHPEWVPENRDNGWRSYCLKCGEPAAGSCQS